MKCSVWVSGYGLLLLMGLAAFRTKRSGYKENPDQVTGRGFYLVFHGIPEQYRNADFDWGHIRFCGCGCWRFRFYSGSLGDAPMEALTS